MPDLGVRSAEARSEGEGSEAVLQGRGPWQRDDARGRLRRVPDGQPASRGPHPELLGVLEQQHGGESALVLPPRGDRRGQEAPGGQGSRHCVCVCASAVQSDV